MGFLKNLIGFENSFTKNFGKDLLENPTRLLTGIDPASTKLWNSVLGRDDQPLVNWFGSPGQQYYDQARLEGIDTGAANKFHAVADTIAGIYGANGLAGSMGFGAGSGPSNTTGLWSNSGNLSKVVNAATGSGEQNGGGNEMGFLSGLFGSGGSSGGGLGGILAGIGGGLLSASSAKSAEKAAREAANTPWTSNQVSTSSQALDPRIASALFGSNGGTGLLGQIQNAMNQPQSPGSRFIGDLSSNYLQAGAGDDLQAVRNAGYDLLKGNVAPAIGAAQFGAAQVNAPSQNALNLSPAYQNFIYGNAAENPYLRQSLQAGVDQSTQAFNTQLGNLTDTLQRQILPGIRGNAIASGQFGSSRQGIAEGLAMSDLSKQAANAARAFGLGNTAATTGALANTFNQGQDRSLSALQGLSGQQYGTALTNAQLEQQAAMENARLRQQADLANAGFGMQNYAQNNAARIAGSGILSGNLNQMYGYNQNADNAAMTRAAQGAGLLSPFLNVGATTVNNSAGSGTGQPQPIYQNTGANMLGGAMAGLGLYNQFSGLFNKGGSSGGNIGTGIANMFPNGY